jgi:two-component system OmpR family sensor kinase
VSLRTRLTLAVVALLALATTLLGGVAVLATRHVLIGDVDQLLRDSGVRQAGPEARAGLGRGGPIELERSAADPYRPVARLVVDAEGVVRLAQPAGFPDDPLPVPGSVDLAELSEGIRTVEVEGVAFRALVRPLRDESASVVLLAPLSEVRDTVRGLLFVVVGAALAVVVVGGGLSWWLMGRGLRPVGRMIGTASAIAGGDLSRRVDHAPDGTELGELARALDDMLAQLEGAFAERRDSEERLRRFVADASHELRTPLATVQGYAELYRRGGIGDDEAMARAMGRIEGEGARMARLVEDLLTLARLDQGQPMAAEAVDLAAVAADVVADRGVVEPGRPVDLVVTGPSTVVGDAARLHQVVANLVGNAAIHTPPGTPVHVSVGPDGTDGVVLRVVDEGAGIPEAERHRVLERFVRLDDSRTRATGGSGLGLAIVAGVVAAHGGELEVGEGSTGGAALTVRLPASVVPPPGTPAPVSPPA